MKPENRLIYFLCTSLAEKRRFSSLYSLALQIRSFHCDVYPHCSVSAGGGKVLVSSKVTFSDSLLITVIFDIVRGDDYG